MFKEYITAFSEGNIQVKHEAFQDEAIVKKVKILLKFYPGVKKSDFDVVAGTLTVEYDHNRISQEKIMDLLQQGESILSKSKK